MKSWEITKKDLRILVRDARALFVLLVLPLVFITIIGLTMGRLLGWKNSNQILRIGVVDNIAYDQIGGPGWDEDEDAKDKPVTEGDKKTVSTETASAAKKPEEKKIEETIDPEEKIRQERIAGNIVIKVMNQLQNRGGFEVKQIASVHRAEDELKYQMVHAAIVFGPNFYRRVSHLRPGELLDSQMKEGLEALDVTLIGNQPGSSTYSLIQQLTLAEVFRAIVPPVLCKNALNRRFMSTTCAEFDQEADAPAIAIEKPKPRPVVQESDVFKVIVPSYTVFFVFFIVTFMARSVLHEREMGTLRRLRIAPLNPVALLAGKTVPFLLISLIQTAILFLCGRFVFDFTWGTRPVMLLPVIFCTSMAATSLGLLVATLVRSESQVSAYATILVITMGGISGCFTPRAWLPDAMREVSLATPHAWSLMAYEELLTKAVPDPKMIFESCAMLTSFAIVFFVAGSLRFRTVE